MQSPPDLTPFCHPPPQVHGDVKPENVMLSGNGTVKIGDFGQSQFFGRRDVFNRTLGTPAYLGAWPGSWRLGVALWEQPWAPQLLVLFGLLQPSRCAAGSLTAVL